jgi:hypothetical protein
VAMASRMARWPRSLVRLIASKSRRVRRCGSDHPGPGITPVRAVTVGLPPAVQNRVVELGVEVLDLGRVLSVDSRRVEDGAQFRASRSGSWRGPRPKRGGVGLVAPGGPRAVRGRLRAGSASRTDRRRTC